MKIDCFFAIFKEDNAEILIKNFVKSKFYRENKEIRFIFACEEKDEINKKFLQKFVKSKSGSEIVLMQGNFTFNTAFNNCSQKLNGDIVLLGDAKISRNDLIFEKCLEKHCKGANIVHIVKGRIGFKNFVFKILSSIYNFFIKIFTGKRDRINIVSLGLIDKNIMDLLKELPSKATFLKNTKDLLGFESRTVYVDGKTVSYKTKKENTKKIIRPTLITSVVFSALLILTIVLNIIFKNLTAFNIVCVTLLLLCLIVLSFTIPKYFFDIRNKI